jgi:hypothetical protein
MTDTLREQMIGMALRAIDIETHSLFAWIKAFDELDESDDAWR